MSQTIEQWKLIKIREVRKWWTKRPDYADGDLAMIGSDGIRDLFLASVIDLDELERYTDRLMRLEAPR